MQSEARLEFIRSIEAPIFLEKDADAVKGWNFEQLKFFYSYKPEINSECDEHS